MNITPTKVAFIQYHQPPLESGKYRVLINQTLDDTGTKISAQHYGFTQPFYVAGERFHLLQEHIKGVFPPAHSLGDYSNVFPHLMLSRNTLPWEREAIPGDTVTPWLALLVIHESEAVNATVTTVTLGDLKSGSSASPFFPEISNSDLEPGQTDAMKIAVLDIKKSLLDQILPDQQTLNFLTHIRQGKDGDTSDANIVGEDLAVLIANRLPELGKSNTVHLVSLENRYNAGGTFNYTVDGHTAGDDDMIRLVTLHSWSFTCTEHFKISETFLIKASDLPQAIKDKLLLLKDSEFFTEMDFETALINEAGLTDQELTNYQAAIFKDFAYGDFANILKHLDRSTTTLRLPDLMNDTENINPYLKTGFYPLPHKLRQGAQTLSWYHSPLSPRSNTETFNFPAKGADALLRYYEANGMFDVSYAAAWELGRLLALQNTNFSTELYQWKRRYAKTSALKKSQDPQEEDAITIKHLQGGKRDYSPESLPSSVTDWLSELKLLKGIPFNYLVPDEQLLPAESIRFFRMNELWVKSLLDGAFSIGRVTSSDHTLDTTIATTETALTTTSVSGFILRSEVVSGWPGMQIEGYNVIPTVGNETNTLPDSDKINVIRRERLSKNVLLCLFEGDLRTLDLHLKPEVLHFGLDPKPEGGYEKELRDFDIDGVEIDTGIIVDVVLNTHRVLDVNDLLTKIRGQAGIKWPDDPALESSADLALQLLEGVERVRFITSS